MADISKKDKAFLNRVYEKARYLKYLKDQDEIVKENRNKIRKKNLLIIAALIPVSILIIFAIRTFFLNPVIMLIICISMLSIGSCYQCIEENVKNEAYNK